MAQKQYEAERVPVARGARILRIVVACFCLCIGGVILLPAIGNLRNPDSFGLVFWGLIVGGVGLFGLVYSVRKRYELKLTAAGRAEKEKDENIAKEKQARIGAAFTGIWFFAAIIFGAFYLYGPIVDKLAGRVAVYPLYCVEKVPATGGCKKGAERAGNVTKYIVHVEQQVVVGLADNAPEPRKLYNCVVADLKNWSCTLTAATDSTRAIMRNGEFSDSPPGSWVDEFRYTSRWNYLVTKYLNVE